MLMQQKCFVNCCNFRIARGNYRTMEASQLSSLWNAFKSNRDMDTVLIMSKLLFPMVNDDYIIMWCF